MTLRAAHPPIELASVAAVGPLLRYVPIGLLEFAGLFVAGLALIYLRRDEPIKDRVGYAAISVLFGWMISYALSPLVMVHLSVEWLPLVAACCALIAMFFVLAVRSFGARLQGVGAQLADRVLHRLDLRPPKKDNQDDA